MAFTEIRYEVADRVATLTLQRPEKLNALTPTMLDELLLAFARADADDEVRAVIVTGAGRAFCAGADLAAGASTFDARWKNGGSEIGVERRDFKRDVHPFPADRAHQEGAYALHRP